MTIKEVAAKFNISYQAAAGLLSFMRETGAAKQFKIEKEGKGKCQNGHEIDFNKLNQLMSILQNTGDTTVSPTDMRESDTTTE